MEILLLETVEGKVIWLPPQSNIQKMQNAKQTPKPDFDIDGDDDNDDMVFYAL